MFMSAAKAKLSLTAEEWESHIQAWEGTSLSKAEYCRQQGVVKDQFHYWYGKLRKDKVICADDAFVKVVSKQGIQSDSVMVEINFPSQMQFNLALPLTQLINLIKELSHATAIIR